MKNTKYYCPECKSIWWRKLGTVHIKIQKKRNEEYRMCPNCYPETQLYKVMKK